MPIITIELPEDAAIRLMQNKSQFLKEINEMGIHILDIYLQSAESKIEYGEKINLIFPEID